MSEIVQLGWSQRQAQSAAAKFRTAMAVYLALYALAGLLAVIVPSVVGHTLDLPPPYGGIRPVGGLMLLVTAFQLPVWQDAMRSRVSALIATIGHFLMALLWALAGGLFLWIALFEIVFAVLLAWLLYKYMTAELMSRP
jgi:peptidoglycan/LPS O-acetylase OafA/YrhL